MASSSSRGDSFKTFLAERKAEYRSKFPFLTESQIVAKLKRLWNNLQAREAAVKTHAADAKSGCCVSSASDGGGDGCNKEGNSAGQPVLMSSKGLPGETLRRKVKPPSLSRSLNRFIAWPSTPHSTNTTITLSPHHPHPLHHLPPSPTNKENTHLPTNSSTTTTSSNSNSNNSNFRSSSSPLQATGPGGGGSFSPTHSQALDCYAFMEDEQHQQVTHTKKSSCSNNRSEGGGSSSSSYLVVKHKQKKLLLPTQPPAVSLSTNTESDQNVTELKSPKLGSSSYGSNLKVATQVPNDSASLKHANNKPKSKQANKKPRGAATTHSWGGRKTRSSARNAVAAATNYHHTTTINSNSGSTTSGVVVISAASAGCGDIRGEQYSLSAQAVISGDNMKGESVPLSDHSRAFDDTDSSLDQEMASDNRLSCTGERQQQEQRQALQPVASAIVDVDLDDECCTTMHCSSVYGESQIMGLALRSSDLTQGNVESGGPLPGLIEHSYGHNINNTINTGPTDAADSALSGVSSCSAALGNPKTDSIPTQTGDSASGSCPLHSREPATCVHNSLFESAEVGSLCDDTGADDLGGTGSIAGGQKRGRRRGRGRERGRGRKRGRKKKDPNESWIQTNSQPQTCDPVGGDLLEFSQTDQISSSLPERTTAQEDVMWEESSLPNMAVPTGGREESSLRKPDQGTRVSFRGRGRRGIRGGGGKGQRGWGAMATGTIRRRVVTRSRTAILLKCNAEEAANREMMDFTSELEKANISASLSPPPPAKKQKQTPPGLEDPPGASGESKAECSSGDNGGVTIMDISASSPANAVCSASDDVALSGAGPANNVCGEPRDSSTASPLFSTASVNSNDGSSKYTPILAINPSREESIAFQTPPLQSHTTTNATTTTTITATGEAGCIGAAEGDGCTGMVSSSGKPCKSSSPSPPFAQCSSSSATGTTSLPQPGQPSMQLTPIQVDPLCDMFLPLTPERKRNDIYKDIGSFYSEAPTERRTVLPAPAGSEDNGYCLFADDADIFL